MTSWDRHVERWVVQHRWGPLDRVFVWLTDAGTHGLVWLVLALALSLAWRRAMPFLLTLLATAAADGIAGLVKAAVRESRPGDSDPLVALPHSHSFPSGHTSTSFAAATVFTAFVPRAAPAFVVLAAAIAYSRLYVGVHYPLDVVGGAAIGVATALLLLAVARRRSVPMRRSAR